MKFLIILFFFTQIILCQKNEKNKLQYEGQKAFISNDFKTAKEKYTNLIAIDSLNIDAQYNLGVTELKLGNTDEACKCFYKLYQLSGDQGALKALKLSCPNFKKGTIMFLDYIDEKPQFIYEGKQYPMIENNNINNKYKELIITEIKKSKILKQKVIGKVYVQIHINKLGIFDGEIICPSSEKKDISLIKMELLAVFRQIATYTPAKYNGNYIELFDKWTLSLDFGY